MNRVDVKKLYLGVYTTDGKHIPIRIITLIKTQNYHTNDQSTESLIGDIVLMLRSLALVKSILVVLCYNASTH